MDPKKFGAFVALCRKEKNMTQLELAQELKVTDKAVSRWERGKGFPDISLLVPLAEALDITVLELMNSEKREKRMEDFSEENVKDMVIHVAAIEEKNQRDDRLITWIPVPVALITAFLTRFTGHGKSAGRTSFRRSHSPCCGGAGPFCPGTEKTIPAGKPMASLCSWAQALPWSSCT